MEMKSSIHSYGNHKPTVYLPEADVKWDSSYFEPEPLSCCERTRLVVSNALLWLRKHSLTTAGCIALIGVVTYFNPLAGAALLLTATTMLVVNSILKVREFERHHMHSVDEIIEPEPQKYVGPIPAHFDDVPDLHNVLYHLHYQNIDELPMLQLSENIDIAKSGIQPMDMEEPVMAGVFKDKPYIAVKFDAEMEDGQKMEVVKTFLQNSHQILVISSRPGFSAGSFTVQNDFDVHLSQLFEASKGVYKGIDYSLTLAKPKTNLPVVLD